MATVPREIVELCSCRKKKRFATRKLAMKTVRVVAERCRQVVRPYHCSFCGGHHLHTIAEAKVKEKDKDDRYRKAHKPRRGAARGLE
jgi:hypothetical protein